ncbi:DUF616 domain-containing protein [Brachyspira hyodysenteriae]|nr:glycosyltransferase domain-containing protein [Brachyspira hyodysenteriae]MDA0073387.1 DUF616 domain-containing protein [Brachyspira hyodysenteriae]
MTDIQKELINKLVWFIPFRKKRDAIRNFLSHLIEEQNNIKHQLEELKYIEHSINSLKKEIIEIKENKSLNKKAIYTCITNGYDNLIIHSYINNDWDYICFTDDNILIEKKTYGNWIIKPLAFEELDNTRNNRWHKFHPHVILNNYEESIYIDSNIDIKTSYLFKCIESMQDTDISISKHFIRDCLYEESDFVSKNNIDDISIIEKQIKIFKEDNFPEHYGLSENNCIYRKHNNKEIVSIMEDWWYWVKNYSKRDQLSLSYVLWKHNKELKYLTEVPIRFDTNNFKFFDHKKSDSTLIEEGKKIVGI